MTQTLPPKIVQFLMTLGTAFCLASLSTVASAQNTNVEQLAKSLANPIAALISVPLQLNYDSGSGPSDGSTTILKIQPVIPISLDESWNLISRTILPVRSQTDILGNSGTQSGFGDTLQSLFFSPKAPTSGGLIWGVGPVLLFPTSTDSTLGLGEWGAGPTGLALVQKSPWTIGGLANHPWSLESDDINSTFLQPFVRYTTPSALTFSVNVEALYDWNSEEWLVPVNASIGKVISLGGKPMSLTAGVGYYAESPATGPEGWRGRLVVAYLFPK